MFTATNNGQFGENTRKKKVTNGDTLERRCSPALAADSTSVLATWHTTPRRNVEAFGKAELKQRLDEWNLVVVLVVLLRGAWKKARWW